MRMRLPMRSARQRTHDRRSTRAAAGAGQRIGRSLKRRAPPGPGRRRSSGGRPSCASSRRPGYAACRAGPEGELSVARAELTIAETALEKTRSVRRAPARCCRSMPRSANWQARRGSRCRDRRCLGATGARGNRRTRFRRCSRSARHRARDGVSRAGIRRKGLLHRPLVGAGRIASRGRATSATSMFGSRRRFDQPGPLAVGDAGRRLFQPGSALSRRRRSKGPMGGASVPFIRSSQALAAHSPANFGIKRDARLVTLTYGTVPRSSVAGACAHCARAARQWSGLWLMPSDRSSASRMIVARAAS